MGFSANFNGKFVSFKGYGAKYLIKEFVNRLHAGTEITFKKAARNWHDGKTKWQH